MALGTVRRQFGMERIEMPPLTGVVRDFLQQLLEAFPRQEKRPDKRFQNVIEILEQQVLRGNISLAGKRGERPHILYRAGELRLPLPRVSSMVAELAPLDLWIKSVLQPGDLLIIDEPEAHLHPLGQRSITRVLVRLIRSGVRVLCTTHSSTILHQLSNQIIASQADQETRKQLGFKDDDIVEVDDVGVYLFQPQDDGTHATAVPVEPEFGVSEEEFARVAEAVGNETFMLSSQLDKEEGSI